jgi:hypothetical protein
MQRNQMVLTQTFSARLAAADLLRAAGERDGGDPDGLRAAATAIDEHATRLSDIQIAVMHTAFGELIRIAAQIVDWRAAVIGAAVDADRFLRAGHVRLDAWREEFGAGPAAGAFGALADAMAGLERTADVGRICLRLSSIPLPLGIDGDEHRNWGTARAKLDGPGTESAPAELRVAFLSFSVDGVPAATVDYLTPNEIHDLEIEARISRWPDDATTLRLAPVSIEVANSYDLPTFEFARPVGDPPFVCRQRGRARIYGGQALRAQPFEFRYAAEFAPQASEQPVAVVGHRTLRFDSIDVTRSPLTGDPAVDARLLLLRNQIRGSTAVPAADLEAAMSLAIGLSRLAVRAVADNIFPTPVPEKEFQDETRDELRRDPVVGPKLAVHGHIAAGIRDLWLGGVPLELKVEHDRVIDVGDGQKFVEQAAAYAVGASKRVAVLGILNAPNRSAAANPASDGIGLLTAQSGLPVIRVVIQGRLSRPSDLSR